MNDGKIDLSKLMKQDPTGVAKESPAGDTPLVSTIVDALAGKQQSANVVNNAEASLRREPPAPVGHKPAQKKGRRYFYSQRPNMGIIISANLRVKFNGNYFDTDDERVAEFVRKHSGLIEEITEEQTVDGHTKLD